MAQVNQQRFGCYIGNIDRSVTLEVLRQVFSQCGTIIDCSLNGRDEDPYRYGFIDFASEDDRARAMKYNGFTLAGRKIKVGVSKGNVGRPEGYNNTSNNNNNSSSNNNNNGGGGGGGGGGNTNNPQQQLQQPQAPAMALAANFLPAVVQQQSTQLLMNLIQRGAVDVNLLTPEQQQALMASLIPPAAAQAAGVAAIQQAAPMPYVPMPQQPQVWGGARGGGYAAGPPMGRGMPYGRGPANPVPSEETVKLREVQRKQFLDVVRRDAEKYERELQERSVKEGRGGCGSGSDQSSNDGDVEKHRRVRRRREDANDGEDATHHEGHHHHHHQSDDDDDDDDNNNNNNDDESKMKKSARETMDNQGTYCHNDGDEMREMEGRPDMEEAVGVEGQQTVDDRATI